MSTVADRFRSVAQTFTDRVEGVEDWDAPAPCEGWVARDVVGHVVEWVPGFLAMGLGTEPVTFPDVADGPGEAWAACRDHVQGLLDDPSVTETTFHAPQMGDMPLDVAIERFILGDVLVHTWDLARATGQDDTIDAAEAQGMFIGMEPMADMLAQSGQFAPRKPVADDASYQDRLIALTGRTP